MRITAATKAAFDRTEADATLVRQQLSCSIETDVCFYQALSSSQYAATGLHTMEEMRNKKGKEKPEVKADEVRVKTSEEKLEVM